MTEADNIFEEEQKLQIAKANPPTSAVSKAPVNLNQGAFKVAADAWSENLIIQLWQMSLNPPSVQE